MKRASAIVFAMAALLVFFSPADADSLLPDPSFAGSEVCSGSNPCESLTTFGTAAQPLPDSAREG
jgi:hypothetical protein